jgi:hypothetical protein
MPASAPPPLELELLAPADDELLPLAEVAEDPPEDDGVTLLEPELLVIAELLPLEETGVELLAAPELDWAFPVELVLLDAAPSLPPSPGPTLLLELEQLAAAASAAVVTMAVTMARFMGVLLQGGRRPEGAHAGPILAPPQVPRGYFFSSSIPSAVISQWSPTL